jgi:hypothetical protein
VSVTKRRALLGLLALAAVALAGGSLPHLHASGEPGLWNEEHDLSLMAALGTVASPLDAAPGLLPVLTRLVTLAPVSPDPIDSLVRLADPRAPPLR